MAKELDFTKYAKKRATVDLSRLQQVYEPGKIYTTKDLATILECSQRTVRRLAREGKIGSVFVNGQYCFGLAHVMDHLNIDSLPPECENNVRKPRQYTESTLREKANKVGLRLMKGFTYDAYGKSSESGYMLADAQTNMYILGPKTANSGYEWELEDVEDAIRDRYTEYGLKF